MEPFLKSTLLDLKLIHFYLIRSDIEDLCNSIDIMEHNIKCEPIQHSGMYFKLIILQENKREGGGCGRFWNLPYVGAALFISEF